jgi:electron transfer flavoprotein alpha subunit
METCDIREQDLLIGVGVGAASCFDEVRRLAVSLGGAAAASRKLADSGVAERSVQVGAVRQGGQSACVHCAWHSVMS